MSAFMKISLLIPAFLLHLFQARPQKFDTRKFPAYDKSDLGVQYKKESAIFRVWAPTAETMHLMLYQDALTGKPVRIFPMKKGEKGTWTIGIPGDLNGKFYTYRAKIKGKWQSEVVDPYARAAGVNGKRGLILDMEETDPPGWQKDRPPLFNAKTEAIIYELHVRDASIHPHSGINRKGKYLGLTEKGSRTSDGYSTGLDHLKELGVTHVHLLPVYDFYSIDESRPHLPQYNWGYDPLNYNVPEGSYATDAENGKVRIREFKELIRTFHENGLRVVMDVAYNHTALTEESNFNQLVPGYYYRHTSDGKFSNATACGNEMASERPMMRKFMLESMKYWVEEFHIDGFRIDLMGVHDIETMNLISKELHEMRPDILLYGEGWTAGTSPLKDSLRALKKNAHRLNGIAVFSDDLRDAIKGHVFTAKDRGFASGKPGNEESVRFGVVASTSHPQIHYSKVNYSNAPYASGPYQTISYVDCHDNHVLWDKLKLSAVGASETERISMHKLALSIVLTSQGIPFLHAGTEFLRSKKGVENSFESPDSINAIDWGLKSKNNQVFQYVAALIKLRKEHPAFRMQTAKQIAENLRFVNDAPEGTIVYQLNGEAVNDEWKEILVIFNGKSQPARITAEGWEAAIINNTFTQAGTPFKEEFVDPFSCTILYRK